MKILPTLLVVALVASGCASPHHATDLTLSQSTYSGWAIYENIKYGLYFRYPNNMRINERNLQMFGLPALRLAVDLVPEDDPDKIVLRFMVEERVKDPMIFVPDELFLKTREGYKKCNFNGHTFVRCFSYGRAARHWSLYYMGKYVYNIFTFTEQDGDDGPSNRQYPILDIIKSVSFDHNETQS